jgi:hypothetical protein
MEGKVSGMQPPRQTAAVVCGRAPLNHAVSRIFFLMMVDMMRSRWGMEAKGDLLQSSLVTTHNLVEPQTRSCPRHQMRSP